MGIGPCTEFLGSCPEMDPGRSGKLVGSYLLASYLPTYLPIPGGMGASCMGPGAFYPRLPRSTGPLPTLHPTLHGRHSTDGRLDLRRIRDSLGSGWPTPRRVAV